MYPRHTYKLALLGILFSILCLPADAEKAKREKSDPQDAKASKFLRLRKDADGDPMALETAVVRYVLKKNGQPAASVDLIGAVHVADKAYFDRLNKLFKSYDAVLYELVAPEGTRIPKGGARAGGSPVSALQIGMKRMLELEFQLEQIDYTKKNFVHADMSPEEFAKSMKDRGESFIQILFRMMGQAAAQQSKADGNSSDVQLLFALFAEDRAIRLKRIMAEQFEDMEGTMAAFNGPNGSTLVTERNKKALGVLARELKAGKRRIAIFYGAGHLPDMEERLTSEFGFQRAKRRWIPAWDLTD